ncbi:MAG: hypothetical protein LEGION0398_MBIBDBAK_00403 [Legionellaceae bacterium]
MQLTSFTLRKSTKAKYIHIKVSRHKGLEIIIPTFAKIKNISQLIDKNRNWIEKKIREYELTDVEEVYPQEIILHAIEQSWNIHFEEYDSTIKLLERNNQLTLQGTGNYKILLKQWLKEKAQQFLLPLLKEISEDIGLSYNRATIRLQSTRWGSCSKNKNIHLNAKLLFLPLPLIKHIIIHELCHTIQFNHSPAFWHLVSQFEPDYQMKRLALRKANFYIPNWIER